MAAFSDDAPSLSELCQAHRELSTALQGLSLIFQETCRHIPDDEPELTEPLAAVGQALADLRRLCDERLPRDEESGASLVTEIGQWQPYQRKLVHDLRNPLGVALGYGELVEETIEDFLMSEPLPWVQGAQQELAHLQEQLQHFLDFINKLFASRPVTGPHTPLHEHRSAVRAAGKQGPPRAAQPQLPKELTDPKQSDRSHMLRGRILVVDDNASNRELLTSMLQREGHETISAASAAEALAVLEGGEIDVCLLDLFMPEMSGDLFLQQLRSTPTYRQLPVIMISGDAELESAIRCIELGAEDYLQKPFNRVLLRARIGASLEKRRLQRELEARELRFRDLLHQILPAPVVARLNAGAEQIADRFEESSIIFCDLVGFTTLSSTLSPAQLIGALSEIFSCLDELVRRHGVEKIKTIGDAYMAAAGLPLPQADHAERAVACAAEMLGAIDTLAEELKLPLAMRIGINSGPVAAGIIGQHRFLYDVWGDTVNLASRLEASGAPGRIHIGPATRAALSPGWRTVPRGAIELKGKGLVETFWLDP